MTGQQTTQITTERSAVIPRRSRLEATDAAVDAPTRREGVPAADGHRPTSGLGPRLRGVLRATPSWLVSMVFHAVALLVLGLLTLPPQTADAVRQLVVAPTEAEPVESLEDLLDEPPEPLELTVTDVTTLETVSHPEPLEMSPADDLSSAALAVELSDIGLEHAPRNDLLATLGAYSGDAFSGRGRGKAQMLADGGGTAESEQAVALALKWLAAHQLADGSWSFKHTVAPQCRGMCRNPGSLDNARNGATAMALLPFLGAGQTHLEGDYREQIRRGLYYLISHMQVTARGGKLYDKGGRMYSHGLAAIALCEAYAMTRDKTLYLPAQKAIEFVCAAQDPFGGGWRYEPGQPGDTSVVGWQLMALKSAHMAYLRVPPVTVRKASAFLDSVQAQGGAQYGYTGPQAGRPATTAIGLLCRMYLGWKKNNPALQRGVKWLSQQGPDKSNVYYNYYATQVLRHWGGQEWKKWNAQMRDYLVRTQARKGHERGSWFLGNGKGHADSKGGRLYHTAMCAMVLEVYYRYMPIYQKQSTEAEFPLD